MHLIFNNHSNLWSYKLASWPATKARPATRREPCSGNFLTDAQVRMMARSAGLVIETSFGYGLLSAKFLRVMSYDRLLPLIHIRRCRR